VLLTAHSRQTNRYAFRREGRIKIAGVYQTCADASGHNMRSHKEFWQDESAQVLKQRTLKPVSKST
jgi:hypothetical protein